MAPLEVWPAVQWLLTALHPSYFPHHGSAQQGRCGAAPTPAPLQAQGGAAWWEVSPWEGLRQITATVTAHWLPPATFKISFWISHFWPQDPLWIPEKSIHAKNQICRINFDKDRGGQSVKNQHRVGSQLKFFFCLNRLNNLQGFWQFQNLLTIRYRTFDELNFLKISFKKFKTDSFYIDHLKL